MQEEIVAQFAPMSPELLWLICISFVIAFLLAFSVGANDVSNSFGTSVGSHVLTVTQACILATFFEVAGATLLGYSVCDRLRRDIYDVRQYDGMQKELLLGALSSLIGSALWNLIATAFKMPISGTHSIIGATIGFSVVLRGWGSIKWALIGRIVASWFASPIVSGAISSIIYLLVSKTVLCKMDPLRYGLKALPLFYGATIFTNVASVVINGPDLFGISSLKWYHGLFISLIAAAITITYVALVIVPRMRRNILDELSALTANKNKQPPKIATTELSPYRRAPAPPGSTPPSTGVDNAAFRPDSYEAGDRSQTKELTLDVNRLKTQSPDGGEGKHTDKPPVAPKPPHLSNRQIARNLLEDVDLGVGSYDEPEKPDRGKDIENGKSNNEPEMLCGERFEIFRLFSTLQILTACFASFAHGSNDVSNAVSPLIPIWNIYSTGVEDVSVSTPVWILAFGGVGICTGLWAWGRAVMATVGEGLTKLTPSKGFSIELGAAISVLLASKFGLPISTTHCKVGSVVIVGLVSSKFLSQDNLLNLTIEERKKQEQAGAVDWKLFGNIAITWVVTVPMAATASALVMLSFQWLGV